MYACDLCGKKFNSGNALGGHKTSHRRSHLQRNDHAINKDDNDDEKQKHSYPVCNKVFSSTKAFCGHMILHCENGSKSIQSPTTSLEQFQFQVGIAPPAIDLTKYSPMPKSHTTNKRSITRRNIIDHEHINGAHTLFHISCTAARGGDHGHLHKKLKASTIVDNDKIEKQVSDINETLTTKVKDKNNRKKSLLLRFKVKDNKVVQCIQGEEKKKNNKGGETGREQSSNELKPKGVVMNFDLNELPTEDVTHE